MQSSRRLEGLIEDIKDAQVGIFLVASLDVADHFIDPKNQEDLIDLVARIVVDGAKESIRLAVGILAGSAAVAMGAPIVLVIGSGIVVGFFVGYVLDHVSHSLHTTQHTQELAHESIDFIEAEFKKAKEFLNNESGIYRSFADC